MSNGSGIQGKSFTSPWSDLGEFSVFALDSQAL